MAILKQLSEKEKELAERQTPWRSVYLVAFFLLLLGLQMSIYFTSTWQYLSETDPTASVDFFGAILALTALSGAFANPLLGLWNQKSGSTRKPIFVAFGIAAIGNLIYGFSYLFTPPYVKYSMLFSRTLTGFGIGALGVLRSFIGTASTKADRLKAVSLTNCGFTAGFFLGPSIQILFIPFGNRGFSIGPVQFTMYTSCAYFMTLISICSILLAYFFLEENYVGIISNRDKTDDPFFVIPKFDRMPVLLMFFMWWLLSGVICVESMSAPFTIATFNWSMEEAVLYNGILQTVSCCFTLVVNLSLASTRLKNCDGRIMIICGLAFFLLFFFFHLPLPIYPETSERDTNGGCSYTWCDSTTKVPLYLYICLTSAVVGIGFPLISASTSTLLSQILGPRKQGLIQGLFAFTGSFAQFAVSIFSTWIFESSGYLWIMCYHLSIVAIAIFGVVILWRRLTPLKLTPTPHIATKYTSGIFYRL